MKEKQSSKMKAKDYIFLLLLFIGEIALYQICKRVNDRDNIIWIVLGTSFATLLYILYLLNGKKLFTIPKEDLTLSYPQRVRIYMLLLIFLFFINQITVFLIAYQ